MAQGDDILKEKEFQEYISSIRSEGTIEVITYIIMFIIGNFGNVVALQATRRQRTSHSWMNFLLKHLIIADLTVMNFVILLEIIWRIQVTWEAGNFMCKVLSYLRAFPLYLTSFIVIVITLDRHSTIINPLSVLQSKGRTTRNIILAYVISGTASIPNAIIFHVEVHPQFPKFTQCVTLDFITIKWMDTLYQISSVSLFYFIPLAFIVVCYTRIYRTILSKTQEAHELEGPSPTGSTEYRESRRSWRKKLSGSGSWKVSFSWNSKTDTTNDSGHSHNKRSTKGKGKMTTMCTPLEAVTENSNCPGRMANGINCENVEEWKRHLKNTQIDSVTIDNQESSGDLKERGSKDIPSGHLKPLISTCTVVFSSSTSDPGECDHEFLPRTPTPEELEESPELYDVDKNIKDSVENPEDPINERREEDPQTEMEVAASDNLVVPRDRSTSVHCSLQSSGRQAIMDRARRRALRMAVSIAILFSICWAPYSVVIIWHVIDEKSLNSVVPNWLSSVFFQFAVASSAFNPYVHSYHVFKTMMNRAKNKICQCLQRTKDSQVTSHV